MAQPMLLKPLDYAVIITVLLLSLVIGLFNGVNKKRKGGDSSKINGNKKDNVDEYFLAGRTMSLVPVAVSLYATISSSTTVIGPATEVYAFGMQMTAVIFTYLPVALLMNTIFVPLFYNMRSMSIYKFLEIRYSRRLKEFITILMALRIAMACSAIIYGTSEACTHVTNVNLWIITGTITLTCTIYTALGGIRGVIWADVFQSLIQVVGMASVAIAGTYRAGGISNIWRRNYETNRTEFFNLNLDPTLRHTFWGDFVGLGVVILCGCVTSQACVHRLLTAPSLETAKKSSNIGFALQSATVLLSCVLGAIVYGAYHGCDPLTTKSVQNMNQLIPRFAVDVLSPYPILPGLFFAGMLSACLSTMSSAFNSMAALLFETFVQSRFPKASEKHAIAICRSLGAFVGISTAAGVVISRRFPNIIQASVSSSSAFDGPLLGVLTVGVFTPQANSKTIIGAFVGAVVTTLWVVAGTLIVHEPLTMKPLFTDQCVDGYFSNSSAVAYSAASLSSHWETYFPLHRLSYQWLTTFGLMLFAILFVLLAVISGRTERPTFPLDIIPENVQRFHQRMPKVIRRICLCDVDYCEEETNVKKEQLKLAVVKL